MKINLRNYVMLETYEGIDRFIVLRCKDCGEESRLNDRVLIDCPSLESIEANHECSKQLNMKIDKALMK